MIFRISNRLFFCMTLQGSPFATVPGRSDRSDRLSVRPRAYQLVPLIMALKQEVVRLLIADDVGVGKTIEALLIVREMVDRGLIKRFAVVCPPHLCDQWQEELRDKFGFEAEVVRSDTAARLDRQIYGDASVFRYFPFQVISIDYIKSEQRRQLFLAECPEMVIVDEAHTCARPPGADVNQQQRHHLIHQISQRADQHLMMLTATPHSGKEEAFQSLLGLLKPEFGNVPSPTPIKTCDAISPATSSKDVGGMSRTGSRIPSFRSESPRR